MDPLKNVAALLDAGGQVMLGTVKPISDAAVAHDGKKTLAMLRRRAARDTSWKHERFFTHKTLSSKDVDDMTLADDDYRRIGVSIVARLLAINGRAK